MADLWARTTSKGDLYVDVVDRPQPATDFWPSWPEGVELLYRPGHPGAEPSFTARYSSRGKAYRILESRGFRKMALLVDEMQSDTAPS